MKTELTLRRSSTLCAVCLFAFIASCSSDSISTPNVAGSLIIEQLNLTSLTLVAGSVLPEEPLIRVTDARTAKPVAGAAVLFIVGPGGGLIERVSEVTDASGLASPGKWQLSTGTGTKSLTAIVKGIKSVLFINVTADVPATIDHLASSPKVGIGGETVDGPLFVVRDQFGNGVPNVPVTFRVETGGGDVLPSTATTNTSGSVTTRVRLGPTGGDNVFVAEVNGVAPDRFVVAALDSASVSNYTLESVREGNNVLTAAAAGVASGTLTISNFDRCLCRTENGYFIIDATYTQTTSEILRRTGKFDIDPPEMIFRAGDATRINFVDGRIEIEILRGDLDWPWLETWIFRQK